MCDKCEHNAPVSQVDWYRQRLWLRADLRMMATQIQKRFSVSRLWCQIPVADDSVNTNSSDDPLASSKPLVNHGRSNRPPRIQRNSSSKMENTRKSAMEPASKAK
jgi:hypothetical protein